MTFPGCADELRSGKPMVGRDGVFTPLLKMLIEGALNGEMDAPSHYFTLSPFHPFTLSPFHQQKPRHIILRKRHVACVAEAVVDQV